jgi:regulator of RNase E activity RraA
MEAVGPWESVGGDIKFLRLKQRAIGGLVTNGSVRDTDEVLNYGFPCFSHSTTACQGVCRLASYFADKLSEWL